MVLFPEVGKAAQEELDRVCGDRLPTLENEPNLPYLRGCVKGCMRWMPTDILGAAGVTWNAWAIRDRIGSILLIAEAANDPDASKRDHFVFGADRRLCQSVHIAERSLLLAIARALWSFEIRKAVDADGKEIVLDAGNLAEGLFVCPKAFSVNIDAIRKLKDERDELVLDPVIGKLLQCFYFTASGCLYAEIPPLQLVRGESLATES
ncbi:p450 domain containing protein [Pyrenophora tritici-repentis]|nr:p450 domain containing protein [Pyrenophora tritici-repentis]